MLSYLSCLTKPYTNSKNYNSPLQAHCCGILKHDKRVYLKASLTIEAALGLPLILFSMIILMMPLRMMNADMQMQAAAEATVVDVSKYMFTVSELQKEPDSENATEVPEILSDTALGAFAEARARKELSDKKIKTVNFLGSEFMRENDMIVVRLDYEYELPFQVFHLDSITQETVAARRAWTGRNGSSGEAASDEAGEDDEMVYVTANGRREGIYHTSPNCFTITKTCEYVHKSELPGFRCCEHCKKEK